MTDFIQITDQTIETRRLPRPHLALAALITRLADRPRHRDAALPDSPHLRRDIGLPPARQAAPTPMRYPGF